VIVSTINVNGIRAAIKLRSPENLGLLPWLAATRADVVCLQETRADDDQLAAALGQARVERAAAYALRWSDHAPVTVDY
jgi:exodeoxyribonuclease-3